MKRKVLLGLSAVFMLISCGSSRRYTSRRVSIKRPKYETIHPKMVQHKTIKKDPVKITYKNINDYIDYFAPVAIREMKLHKIPASITLAQGILESGAGKSELAQRSNNHFGIKCHNDWEGTGVTHDDDELAECFRRYDHPEDSYIDHSNFLTKRKRYERLFRLSPTDYRGWAYGLKRAGYATDRRYPSKLIELIRKYELYKYDRGSLSSVPSHHNESAKSSVEITTYTVVKGDTLYSISKRYNTTVEHLKQVNHLSSNAINIGQKLVIK